MSTHAGLAALIGEMERAIEDVSPLLDAQSAAIAREEMTKARGLPGLLDASSAVPLGQIETFCDSLRASIDALAAVRVAFGGMRNGGKA